MSPECKEDNVDEKKMILFLPSKKSMAVGRQIFNRILRF